MKLLDEKGLTTVWAAIKNTFTSKSDADGKYAKTADVNTALAKKVDAVSGKGLSTNDFTAAYKSKLDGIASGANNYTLPVASTTTLGGIKVSGEAMEGDWPIVVDNNGLAYTSIGGLQKGDDGSILGIQLIGSDTRTYYGTSSIEIEPYESENSIELTYPVISGTFALISDLENVCNFKFTDISECVGGSINFSVLTTSKESSLDNIRYRKGIIIFAYAMGNCYISCSDVFTYNGIPVTDKHKYIGPGMFLITANGGTVNIYSF